ncbi:MAG: type II toxin-antitoxin system RelE/ParE family toxin [Chloroflexi bacterium]|nr:type II toxin-antitoxin system RelE/ParE family toxin [Chloroflexota bacterium]MCI0797288.1 type II toxin-antitoxin system RelE/ParE family toxin [Chloroflexota bacterium]
MNTRFLEIAQRELDEAVDYYNAQAMGLGDEFLLEVVNALERIRNYPEAWQRFTQNTRRCRTRRFSTGIIYQVLDSEILIVAVAHLHREPGHWQDRI